MNKPDAKGMFQETTLTATSRNRQKQYADKVYIISRYDKSGKKTPDLHTLTWNEIAELTESLAKGLDSLGIKPLDRVAVIGPNTPRWMQAVFAIGALRGTVVPVYPTSKQDDVWWIIHDSAVKAVFCHGKEHVEKALEAGKKEQELKHVIVMDPSLKVDDPRVISFDALLDLGRKNSKAANLVETRIQETTPDDLAAIIYTSGTTGRPKGFRLQPG
jgi:long-chain acyl-CoA synthetase